MSINTENPEIDGAPDVESAWSEEIKRRLTEIDAGKVELIPWEEVRAELLCCSHQS
ncbi:MAG TPA: addiction module protein [Pyrinomonadaceae bacterium]